jgi:DNA-binding transcriptional LysR family regulator
METIAGHLDRVLAFVEVAEAASFTRAATRLQRSKAYVSKQVAELERELGTQLLHRTTRRLALTDSGRLFLEHTRGLPAALADARSAVSAHDSSVRGRIRLTAPLALGEGFLTDLALAFRERYPDVAIELDLSILRRDLIGDGFDLALRQTRALDEHLVARPLGVVREVAVASPAFVAAHGPLEQPAELARVPCIINSHFGDDQHWLFEHAGVSAAVTVHGPFRVNFFSAIKRAALAGAGVARLPLFMLGEELASGRLVRVCAGHEPVATPLWLLWPQRRVQPLRVKVFVEFLLRWFEAPERRAAFR